MVITASLADIQRRILEVHLLSKRMNRSLCKSGYNVFLIIQLDCSPRMISLGHSDGWAISTSQWLKIVMNSACTIPPHSVRTLIPISWPLFLDSQLVNVKPG